MPISIADVQQSQLARWQAYVAGRPAARAHHDAAWFAILTQSFGVTPHYLWAVDERDSVRGVLPMYFSRSWFTGSHLATFEGGALADAPEISALLYGEAEVLRDRLGAGYLLLRDALWPHRPAAQAAHYARTVVSLSSGLDTVWRNVAGSNRANLRKAFKRGVVAERDDAAVHAFYQLYARRMRDLGTPVESLRFFTALRTGLGSRFRLFVARLDRRVVAGMLCVAGQTWAYLYGASDRAALGSYPNEAVFWAALSAATQEGATSFDLGASAPGTGAQRFKAKWSPRAGSLAVTFGYYSARPTQRRLGLDAMRTTPSLRQRVWSRVPLPIANQLGPLLRLQLPFA